MGTAEVDGRTREVCSACGFILYRNPVPGVGVLVEMRADAQGILRPVPHTANTDPKRGARVADGWLQLGLRRKEIRKLQERLEALLEEVDSGGLATF